MNLPKISLTICLCALLASCIKKSNQPGAQIPPNDASAIVHYELNPDMKPYYDFKDDSYWIYSDSAGTVMDSLYILNYKASNDSTKMLINNAPTTEIYRTISYTLKGNKNTIYVKARDNRVEFSLGYLNGKDEPPALIYYSLAQRLCENEDYTPSVSIKVQGREGAGNA